MLRIIVLLFFTLFTLNGQTQFWKKSRIAAIKIYERAKNSQWDYSHKRVPDPVINAMKRNSTLKLDSAQLARNAKSKVLSSSPAQPSQPKEEKTHPATPRSTVQRKKTNKNTHEKVLNRFLSYVKIESQSVDVPDFNAFPMTEGQKKMATFLANEIQSFGGKDVEVTVSKDF